MAKSHAQRQKEYCERKKAESGSNWLENESKRTQKYYTKITLLDERDAQKRRKKLREKQASYRARKRATKNIHRNETVMSEPGLATTSSSRDIQDAEISSSSSRMIVKLPCTMQPKRKSGKKYQKKIEYLKSVQSNLKRKNQTLRQKVSRLRHKMNTNSNNASPRTPRSKSESEMKKAGMLPAEHPHIRKKLMFANCLAHAMKTSVLIKDRKGRNVMKRMVAGTILRKYKLTQYAANLVGIRVRSKPKLPAEYCRDGFQRKAYRKIREFLERDDNSRQLPGKADAVKNERKEHVQKFVLNDYLRNIYIKFRAENPGEKVSFATFWRARPKHVTLVNYASRITCLCTKHQNFAIKLQCLKRYGATTNTSPDSFSESTTINEMKLKLESNVTQNPVEFKEWKRVKCDDGKQRRKLLDMKKDNKVFTEDIVTEFQDFKDHARRVKTQFQSFKQMKESLTDNKSHVCVQMDFAENYSIKEMEEIQSAYWNPESVTLHPVVMYYGENGELAHSSMIVVSEVLNHNTSMVCVILEKVIEWVKGICPNVRFIHYWTDSPTSQYRNKMMFDAVARHPQIYGLQASWHFFEAGHGKGACDGIGGVVKRSADTAVKTGKVNITCGKDFFEWGVKADSKILYRFVERSEYDDSSRKNELRQKDVNTVKGTIKIHAVVGVNENEVMVRDTTCVCNECFTIDGFVWSETNTYGWTKHNLQKKKPQEKSKLKSDTSNTSDAAIENTAQEDTDVAVENDNDEDGGIQITEGEYIASVYDGDVYIGKVIDIDDGQYEVTFSWRMVRR